MKKVSRKAFETLTGAQLSARYSRTEILKALESYGATKAIRRSRPKHNEGNLAGVWVAIEWKRAQSKSGKPHSVSHASKLLAEDLKAMTPGSGNVARVPRDSRLRAMHQDATLKAANDSAFRDLLERHLTGLRAAGPGDDELLPAFLIGGPETTVWLRFSDSLPHGETLAPEIVA